ncbi:MAG: AraC family transcriptional regulator [Myxococcales bacterium]|nr:AraC family transcriptional regulator [Myxococcales bacterium]
MSMVTAQIVRRLAAVALGSESSETLLARVGIDSAIDTHTALTRVVDAETYYDLLERATGDNDTGLPFRYAVTITPDDFGAMGLAFKTAATVREALERLMRYILVLSDSLAYELCEDGSAWAFHVLGRPPHRRGAALANEAALAAIISLLRQVATVPVTPTAVSFRHPKPSDSGAHDAFFGCPVRWSAERDALWFDEATLQVPAKLADAGLSSYLLAHLEDQRARLATQTTESRVYRAVVDSLCDGSPDRVRIAQSLGMSDRTLRRRLADEGTTFRVLVDRARQDAARSLLARPDHSLADIAYLTGFADQSAFQRAFKRWSGQTPRAYREGSAGPG